MKKIFLIIIIIAGMAGVEAQKKDLTLASSEIHRFEERFGDINPEKAQYVTSILENKYGVHQSLKSSGK